MKRLALLDNSDFYIITMSCDLLVPSSLGFQKAKCCKTPCPNLPPVRVNICVQVNQTSKILIQQGCYIGEPETNSETAEKHPCRVDWKPTGLAATAWGDKFRRVTYSYWVPYKTYMRIRVCANTDTGCDGGCPELPLDSFGEGIPNKIIRFEVNGVDVVESLNTTDLDKGFKNCVFIGCQDVIRGVDGPTYPVVETCCHTSSYVAPSPAPSPAPAPGIALLKWTDAALALPWGSEIVVGPVGTTLGL